MFIVRGQSGSSNHSIVTHAGENAYRLETFHGLNADFGFYLLNLNFTDVVLGQDVSVSYQFKILANDTVGIATIDPTNWAVKYTLGNSWASNASFTHTAGSFNFADNNTTWTTVSGSFVIPAGTGLSNGAIFINDGSSATDFSSGKSLYLADLRVTVAAVPEPSAFALVAGVMCLVGAQVRRRRS